MTHDDIKLALKYSYDCAQQHHSKEIYIDCREGLYTCHMFPLQIL